MSVTRRDSVSVASLPANLAWPFSRMVKSIFSCLMKGGIVMS